MSLSCVAATRKATSGGGGGGVGGGGGGGGVKRRQTPSTGLITTSFLQPLLYLVTPQVPENCQLTSSFLLVLKLVSLLQTSQITSDICFITDHVAYASSDKTSHLNRDGTLFSFSFLTLGG